VVDTILHAVVNAFEAERSGKATARFIRKRFPQAVPVLTQYLDYPEFAVELWLRGQPVIEPILDHPEFPSFFLEFKRELRIS
jgi:hypothetical protein